MKLDNCPNCNASFKGDPIPPDVQHHYGVTHYSRRIAIYDEGRDCTVGWRCPDCHHFIARDQQEVEAVTDPVFFTRNNESEERER